MRFLILCSLVFLAACDVPQQGAPVFEPQMSPAEAARSFGAVVRAVEPVAERECRNRTSGVNCDFRIAVDSRKSEPANAFQHIDEQGRPVITFTVALIASAATADEMAFVMSHEAAHHIMRHIERQRQNAQASAVVFGGLATLTGGDATDIEYARKLGAVVGARSYSREFELEADELGTIITYRAGYNPLKGARFFTRIPDPGDRFLGTHPPNDERLMKVRTTSESLGL